tara:strand:+ start:21 stop:575 length:555 start_codon:yes stop_codon:yes gene_type:complete
MKKPLAILLLLFNFVSAQETIAVIDFEGIGISQLEAKALSERLRDELVITGKQKIFESGEMDEIFSEKDFQQSGCNSNECAVEAGKLLSVERIIIGSIRNVGSAYTISAQIVSVGTGEIIKSTIYDYQGNIDGLIMIAMKEVSERLFPTMKKTTARVPEKTASVDQLIWRGVMFVLLMYLVSEV